MDNAVFPAYRQGCVPGERLVRVRIDFFISQPIIIIKLRLQIGCDIIDFRIVSDF